MMRKARAPRGLTALVRVLLVLGFALCTTRPALASEVPLTKEGGVYVVPVQINGAITLDFVVDSGAAEVNVPADVVMTLVRAKTIAPSDFLPGRRMSLRTAPVWRAEGSLSAWCASATMSSRMCRPA